ncbi:unnamed protein product, partial [Didymodactylos carnosus]
VCIIGAGPCGLRLAIECALLGARCIVVEKRDRFSRHNVLHLWRYVITDLKNLGAKFFYGKFAFGSIEHISIRQLQCILLKIALLLGVEICYNVTFEDFIDATPTSGWRGLFLPSTHWINTYEFNALIGADGRRNSLQGFHRKEFRGKLAIGVTANFVHHHTREEQLIEEISGVARLYNPQFFQELKQQTSIDLENIAYYKNDTHYFVMTAKKQSLLEKDVIKNDYPDAIRLLARENVNFEALCNFACEAAQFATKTTASIFEFAENHYGLPDVQMFDFTSLFHAVNASRIVERNGKRLFMALVGDSLLEPFWPLGTGIGHGFLATLDTAWVLQKFAKNESPLKILAERESIYLLLSQSTPENTKSNYQLYTINPASRYQHLNSKRCTIEEIRHLYDNNNNVEYSIVDNNNNLVTNHVQQHQSDKHSKTGGISNEKILNWCQMITEPYGLQIKNDTQAFNNGLAFCAIIHRFRPELIDYKSLQPERSISNFQILFDILREKLHIQIERQIQNQLLLLPKNSSSDNSINDSIMVLLTHLYTHFHLTTLPPSSTPPEPIKYNLSIRRSSTPLTPSTNEVVLKRSESVTDNEGSAEKRRSMKESELNTMTKKKVDDNNSVKVSELIAHYTTTSPIGVKCNVNNNAYHSNGSVTAQPTFCFYCKDRVPIQEWFPIENVVLHVRCFRCETCQLQLRKTNYQCITDPISGKLSFHCRYHNLNDKLNRAKDNHVVRILMFFYL